MCPCGMRGGREKERKNLIRKKESWRTARSGSEDARTFLHIFGSAIEVPFVDKINICNFGKTYVSK